jgi:hypothetical protein
MVHHNKPIFGTKPENLEHTLSRLINESYVETNCSMDEAYKRTRQLLDYDRRFDQFDRDRLVAKAREIGASGGKLDLTDPWLYGGQKRPLSR